MLGKCRSSLPQVTSPSPSRSRFTFPGPSRPQTHHCGNTASSLLSPHLLPFISNQTKPPRTNRRLAFPPSHHHHRLTLPLSHPIHGLGVPSSYLGPPSSSAAGVAAAPHPGVSGTPALAKGVGASPVNRGVATGPAVLIPLPLAPGVGAWWV